MAVKQILFNTEMVKAILEDRKTQTRRFPFPAEDLKEFRSADYPDGWWYKGRVFRSFYEFIRYPQSPRCKYRIGDILWVRETWSTHYDGIHDELQFCYKADGIDLKSECLPGENNRWYPSIHMPKEAARIFLQVKNVHLERLQRVTNESSLAEGVPDDLDYPISPVYCPRCKGEGLIGSHMGHGFIEVDCPSCDTPVKRFSNLWNSTVQKSDLPIFGWESDPWVWVIEFERCEKPEGWCAQ